MCQFSFLFGGLFDAIYSFLGAFDSQNEYLPRSDIEQSGTAGVVTHLLKPPTPLLTEGQAGLIIQLSYNCIVADTWYKDEEEQLIAIEYLSYCLIRIQKKMKQICDI